MFTLLIDPSNSTPQRAAEWACEFVEALPSPLRDAFLSSGLPVASGLVTGLDAPAGSIGYDEDGGSGPNVDGQLDRLARYWPAFEGRLRRMHTGLVELGYQPCTPQTRSARRQASYVRYVDPVDGRGLGGTNSGTFTFSRAELKGELASNPDVKIGRYPTVHFDTDDKVTLILEIASRVKR
jgi:hypothetical protein